MRKITKNENGLTLVEILATVIILFIVCIFVYNIIFSANKQNTLQVTESKQINDAAYILKQITKDIRKTYDITINPSDANHYYFNDKNNNTLIEYIYTADNSLYRDGGIIANNINSFSISPNSTTNTATITFVLNEQPYNTTLAFRRGDP
ncbi:PilW family protein [Lysinibacillus sp. LZ02]|uniref:PilW family protein n=1 Tax=Lysinibacillus sp. LZ02 TaxID=3420668 RepID=UPI003D36FF08